MAVTPDWPRRETRTARKVFVELYSFDNAAYEITNTIDVSPHGARVLSKNPWAANQRLSVRSVLGHLYSSARIVYCQPRADKSFDIGLELHQPTEDWPAVSATATPSGSE
jgi:hypothetical protein